MNAAELFDRALDREDGGARAQDSLRTLLAVAAEVADALAAVRLSGADHERIYARSLALLEEAVAEHRRGWQRVLRLERPAPAIVGGAALTIGAAAIGWAVLHGRRASSRPMAA